MTAPVTVETPLGTDSSLASGGDLLRAFQQETGLSDQRLGYEGQYLTWAGHQHLEGLGNVPLRDLADPDTAEEVAHWIKHVLEVEATLAKRRKAAEDAEARKHSTTEKDDEGRALWRENKNGTKSLNVAVMAEMVGSMGAIRSDAGGLFWAFDEGVFSPAPNVIRDRCVLILQDAYSREAVGKVSDYIAATGRHIDLDAVPHADWINFRNCMVNWKTDEIAHHSEDFGSTSQVTAPFNPLAACPMFDRWVEAMVPAGTQPLLWQVIGYSMLCHNPQQVFVYLEGPGGNGKGVVQRTIRKLLGEDQVSSVSWKDIDGNNQFKLSQMVGKAANVGGEVSQEYVKDSANLKAITGGDYLDVERKGRDGFSTRIHALLIFAGNEVPRMRDDSDGLFQRLLVIPFPNSSRENAVAGFNEDLLVHELPGIAFKALRALQEIEEAPGKRADAFAITADLQEAKNRFQEATNAELEWIRNYTTPKAGRWSTPMELYRAFGGTGERPTRKFSATLKKVYGEPKMHTPSSWASQGMSTRTRCYEVEWFNDPVAVIAQADIDDVFGGVR